MKVKPRGKYWDEFVVGEVLQSSGRTIGAAEVSLFTGLSGDFNPVHTNEVSAKDGIYGERIGHGLLTLAVSSGQLNQLGHGEGTTLGFLGMDNVRFKSPVRFGDTVFTTAVITEVRATSKPGRGITGMSITVRNQRDEIVLQYDQALLRAARPVDPE